MAYRQPRPPQLRGDNVRAYIAELTRFLREFTLAAWDADRRRDAQIEAILRRLEKLEE